jgi:hypothetical protein
VAVLVASNNTAASYTSLYTGLRYGIAQSCKPDATGDIYSIKFQLLKVALPTGAISVEIWSHDAAEYGVAGEPLALIATSTTSLDCGDLTGSYAEYEFLFAAGTELTSGTAYCVVLWSNNGDVSNYIRVQRNDTSVHDGNYSDYVTSWGANSARDLWFELYEASGGGPAAPVLSASQVGSDIVVSWT